MIMATKRLNSKQAPTAQGVNGFIRATKSQEYTVQARHLNRTDALLRVDRVPNGYIKDCFAILNGSEESSILTKVMADFDQETAVVQISAFADDIELNSIIELRCYWYQGDNPQGVNPTYADELWW